jgi:hypothetical protein
MGVLEFLYDVSLPLPLSDLNCCFLGCWWLS